MRRASQAAILVAVVGTVAFTLFASDTKKPAIKAAPKAQAPKVIPDDGGAEATIRKSAEAFTDSYTAHDAKAIAATFAADGEFINEEGQVVAGRQAIQAHFEGLFQNLPEAKVRLKVESVKLVAPNVAIEEGIAETMMGDAQDVQTSRYVALHVKQGNEWLIARSRDFPAEGTPISHHDRLRPLEWLVGDWIDESADALISTTCRWADGENFLVQEFSARFGRRPIVNGSTRIGWDPLAKQVRSWTFDSDGGFSEGLWTKTDEMWIMKSNGVTSDGRTTSATTIVRRIDADTISWESRDRVVGEEVQSDIPAILVKRRGPLPAE